MQNKFWRRFFDRFYLFVIFAFLYAPILLLSVYSFNKARIGSRWTGFTFQWYKELFMDRAIMQALHNTLILAVLSAVIATLIGAFGAFGLLRLRSHWRSALLHLNRIPLISPDLVLGVSLMSFFIMIRVPPGFWTILIAHISFNIPYTILLIFPKLRTIPTNRIEAAYDLGATSWHVFWRIIFPEISSSLLAALLVSFTLSVDDFIISFFTSGSGFNNLGIVIHSMAKRGIRPSLNALVALMLLVIFILLVVVNRHANLIKLSHNIEE